MTLSDPDPRPVPQRPRRWLRPLGIGGTALLVIVVAVVGLLQLPPVATAVAGRLVTLAPFNPGNRLEIGRVSGNFLHGLTLENVLLRRHDRILARLSRVRLGYRLADLRPPDTRLEELSVESGSIVARREGERWDVLEVLRRSSDTAGSAATFAIERLRVHDVTVAAALAPDSVARLQLQALSARNLSVGETAVVALDTVRLAIQPPASARWLALSTRGGVTARDIRLDPLRLHTEASEITGRVIVPRAWREPRGPDGLDVRLAARPLALADLAAFSPAVPATGELSFDLAAQGRGDDVSGHLAAALDRGRVTLDGSTRLDRGTPASYRVRGGITDLDPARLSVAAPAGSVTARFDAAVTGRPAKANGTARLDLGGSRFGRTRVRELVLDAVLRDGAADLTLRSALDSGRVRARGLVRAFDSIPSYRLSGTAVGLPGTAAIARGLTGNAGDPSLAASFRVQGEGFAPDSARARGRLELVALTDTGAARPLGHAALRLAGGRLELTPTLLIGGGTVTARGRVTLGDTISYQIRDGRIDRVDLARLAGDSAAAPLSGRFSLSGAGTAPADARVVSTLHLDELRYGARKIERVDAVIRLAGGRLRLSGEGAIQGGRLVLEALGRPFDSTASYVLRRGALEQVDLGTLLGRPDLAGPVTLAVTGEGSVRGPVRSGRATVTVAPSRLGRIEVEAGRTELRLAGDLVSYDATLRTNGGEVAAAGEAAPAAVVPVYRVSRGRLTHLDLGALLGRPDLRTDLNSTFTADLTRRPADSALQGTASMTLFPSRINRAELASGSMEARLDGPTTTAALRATGPDAQLEAKLMAAPAGSRQALTADGTLRVEHLSRWTGRGDADGRLESSLALRAETDSAGLRSVGGTVNALGGYGEIKVPALHLALQPVDGQLQVDTLLVRSNVALIDGSGRLQLRPSANPGANPGALNLAAVFGDLGPIAALLGADSAGADSARMRLTVEGPAWHWRLKGGGAAYGLAYGGNLANRIALEANATLDSTRLAAVAGKLDIQDAALGQLSVRELSATGGYDSTVALDLKLNIGDSVRVDSRLRGTVATTRDTVTATLERLTLDEGGRAWTLDRPAELTLGPLTRIRGLALRAGPRSILMDGTVDPHGVSDFTVQVNALELATLRASGLVPVAGRLDGRLHLTGEAASPRLEGGVTLAIVGRGRQTGTVGTKVDWTSSGLKLSAAARPLKGSPLTVEGALPYRLTLAPRDTSASVGSELLAADDISLAVRADSFDLALFQPLLPPEAATGLGGRLRTDARITGTIKAPQATGTVNLIRATLKLPTIGVAYQRGELAGRLEGDALRIDKLRLLTDKHEELLAQGQIGLTPLSDPSLALEGTLTHFRLVHSDQLRTAASGRIRLAGTLSAPEVTGTVQLDRTDFFVGAGGAQVRVEPVELTSAQVRDLARDFGPDVLQKAEQQPGLMDRAKLDLAIQMPRQVWIRRTSSPKSDIELMGRLRLTQRPGGEMQFFGHVEPVPDRGTLELNGKQFRLTDGDINLAGPVDSTRLDVNASYQVPTQGGGDDEGVLINVNAKGRLDSLALEFTSDPTMSQDDILSYIVTGRPASDNPLFEGQESGGNAGEQVALGTLTGAISNAAGQGLGFDVFQIRQEPTRGLTLTAGRYLGSRLFLDFQLPLQLGSQSQQTAGSNLGPGFELEYTLQRWLRASLRGGSLPPGLLFRARRAY
ncbi:MAG TPA: translocation/assembly module TamB domain-containing protein [Gemmatimonadales bacterium]|nr:translocation/assembly module TamB domain-containing protein [Gemmatimonadales bacterium]